MAKRVSDLELTASVGNWADLMRLVDVLHTIELAAADLPWREDLATAAEDMRAALRGVHFLEVRRDA